MDKLCVCLLVSVGSMSRSSGKLSVLVFSLFGGHNCHSYCYFLLTHTANEMLESAVLFGGGLSYKLWFELSQYWSLVCIWFTGLTLSHCHCWLRCPPSQHIWLFDIGSASQKLLTLQSSASDRAVAVKFGIE